MPCVNDMPTDIKKYLKSAGITQKQFAEKMNLSRPTLDTYIEMYEHGQTLPKKKYDDYFNKLFKSTNNSLQMFISELQKIESRDGNSTYCRLDSLESDAEDYISLIVRNMRKDFETEGWNRNIYTFINILISNYRKNDVFQYLAEYFVYLNSIENVENISSKQIPYFANMFKTFRSLSENPENYDQQDYKDFIKYCKEIRDNKRKEYNKREDFIKGEIKHILLSYERKGVNLSDQEILEKLTTHLSQISKKEKKTYEQYYNNWLEE